jgi:hypothetical protein
MKYPKYSASSNYQTGTSWTLQPDSQKHTRSWKKRPIGQRESERLWKKINAYGKNERTQREWRRRRSIGAWHYFDHLVKHPMRELRHRIPTARKQKVTDRDTGMRTKTTILRCQLHRDWLKLIQPLLPTEIEDAARNRTVGRRRSGWPVVNQARVYRRAKLAKKSLGPMKRAIFSLH